MSFVQFGSWNPGEGRQRNEGQTPGYTESEAETGGEPGSSAYVVDTAQEEELASL